MCAFEEKGGKNAQVHKTPLSQHQDASVNILNEMTHKVINSLLT